MMVEPFEPYELPRPRTELRRAIRASDFAAWQIAHLIEVSPATLSNIVVGKRAVTREEAERIAGVLERDVDELFPGETFR